MLQTFQVFIVSGNVIKIYAEGGLVYAVHGLGTEVLYWAIVFFQLVVQNVISVMVILDRSATA